MIAEEIPSYLKKYVDKVNELKIFDKHLANHILLNRYDSGEGILSHFDGSLFYPTISTISVGSHTVIEFNKPMNRDDESCKIVKEFKLFIAPRSLLILKDDLYTQYMHAISEIEEDDLSDVLLKNSPENSQQKIKRSTRFSLTIRHVPKTSKFKLKFHK